MATAAKQSSSSSVRGSSPASSSQSPSSSIKTSSSTSSTLIEVRSKSSSGHSGVGVGIGPGEEDIETIAKQISDHAEAIYQTWKARGLAPTEILNCHSVNSDAFGKSLTPPQRNQRESPVNELLAQSPTMSNSNLKKLVSSFVNEDKARQQQTVARKTNILTSGTIRDALRKFESVDSGQASVKPNFVRSYSTNSNSSSATTTTKSSTVVVQQRQTSPQPVSPPQLLVQHTQPLQELQKQLQQTQQQLAQSHSHQKQQSQQSPQAKQGLNSNNYNNQLNKNVPDVLINTIEQVKLSAAPENHNPTPVRVKPETPAKPASLLNHTPAWPLKNRPDRAVLENGNAAKSSPVVVQSATKTVGNGSGGHEPNKTAVKKSENKIKSTNLMDEVLMEEERLINALKTGTVLNNNDKVLPEVITSTLTPASANAKPMGPWPAERDESAVKPSALNNGQISEVDGGQVKFTAKPRHKNDAAVPHPEVHLNSSKTNSLTNSRSATTAPAVRPFLTRGSVAERVLMFEKCPEIKALRGAPKEPSKLTVSCSDKHISLSPTFYSFFLLKFHGCFFLFFSYNFIFIITKHFAPLQRLVFPKVVRRKHFLK